MTKKQKEVRLKTTLPDDLIQHTKYKWEFLRRNPKYIDGWKELQDKLEKLQCEEREIPKEELKFVKGWRITHPFHPEEKYKFVKRWRIICHFHPKEEYKFAKKWRITESFHPGLSYEEILKYENYLLSGVNDRGPYYRNPYEMAFFHLQPPETTYGRPIEVKDGWDWEGDFKEGSGRTIRSEDAETFYGEDGTILKKVVSERFAKTAILGIYIDLNYSKSRLIKEFSRFIDEWKKRHKRAYEHFLYRKFCKEKEIGIHSIDNEMMAEFKKTYKNALKERDDKYNKKLHFDNFDIYLQVYDLRNGGKSWSNIASELNLNSIQTARNHYRAACEIIKKGIDIYVK